MDTHVLSGRNARRPAAALVLVVTVIACVWLGEYRVWVYTNGLRPPYIQPVTPGWATPVVIAVGVGGAVVALVILRFHRTRR